MELRQGGVSIRSLAVPVDRAGCYVPGGRARYPSTVLMTAIVAKVAGVGQVVRRHAAAARRLASRTPRWPRRRWPGVDEVYRVGGAQAIAALAYGTETIDPVDVIVGPGNVYVAIAKREVARQGLVGVPSSFAGPSEVVVVADGSVDGRLRRHRRRSCRPSTVPTVWPGSSRGSRRCVDAVEIAVARLVAGNPRRRDIEATFAGGGHAGPGRHARATPSR